MFYHSNRNPKARMAFEYTKYPYSTCTQYLWNTYMSLELQLLREADHHEKGPDQGGQPGSMKFRGNEVKLSSMLA